MVTGLLAALGVEVGTVGQQEDWQAEVVDSRSDPLREGASMSETGIRSHQDSVTIAAPADLVYDVVSDVTRTGEWSPVCTSCWWDDDAQAGRVGAWFTGRNQLPDRTWETRSVVVEAERGREFAWVVGGRFVRWGFTLAAAGDLTRLTESWQFLPDGIVMFQEKYGDEAPVQIADRTRQALDGIPVTLAAIKRVVEASV